MFHRKSFSDYFIKHFALLVAGMGGRFFPVTKKAFLRNLKLKLWKKTRCSLQFKKVGTMFPTSPHNRRPWHCLTKAKS